MLLPPGKPFATLALIALHTDGISRDDLASYLWAGSDPARAKASLRQALHVLRKALSPEAVAEDRGLLSVDPTLVSTDLGTLEAALAAKNLDEAHRLWAGGPFAHFSLADAPGFNEWADGLRTHWERRLGSALEQKALTELRDGHTEDALVWFGRCLDVRPFDETTHIHRIELLLQGGMLDEAEAALTRALGVVDPPIPEALDVLSLRLREARRALLDAEDGGPAYPTLEFVGRTAEMATLRALRRSALSGRPRSVAVLGRAGVGKSRLIDEFLRYTVGGDTTVVRVKALDSERAMPLGMVAEAAKALSTQRGAAGITNASLSVLQQVVPTLGNATAPPSPGPLTEVAVAEALLDLQEAVAHESPLVLVVEDLHWADAQSRAVLLRVARSLRGVQALTFMTCRSGDADLSTMRTLHREAEARRLSVLELEPLSEGEVLEALTLSFRVHPIEDEQRLAQRLWTVTRGNPLFLSQLIVSLHAMDVIERAEDGWHFHATRLNGDLPLPNSVREILEARLNAVSPPCHQLLGALAAAPSYLPSADLATWAGLSAEGLDGAASELVGQGILIRDEDGRLSFSHDALRERAREVFPFTPPDRKVGPRPSRHWILPAAAVLVLALGAFWAGSVLAGREPPARVSISATMPDGETLRQITWDGSSLTVGEDIRAGVGVISPDGARLATMTNAVDGINIVLRTLPSGTPEEVTDFPLDEEPLAWSPDGSRLLFAKGVLLPGEARQHLWVPMVLEVATGKVTELSGFTIEGIREADWSADGTALVLAGTRDGVRGTFLTVPDGRSWRRILPEVEEPQTPSFSPDGTRVAVHGRVDGVLGVYVGWVNAPRRPEMLPGSSRGRTPVWLDDRTVAYLSGDAPEVVVAAQDSYSGEVLDHLPIQGASDLQSDRRGGDGWYVDSIRVDLPSLAVAPGQVLRPRVHLLDNRARSVESPVLPPGLRSDDPSRLAIDTSGAVTVLDTGTVTLSVGHQGWRERHLVLRSAPVRVDSTLPILFEESWVGGIAPDRWAPFGEPQPYTRVDGGPEGGGYFVNNGDTHFLSGVVSRVGFDPSEPITVEVWAQVPLSGRHYEGMEFGFTSRLPEADLVATWDPRDLPTAFITGEQGDRITWLRAEQATFVAPPVDPRGWHRYAWQWEGDGRIGFFVDGRLLVRAWSNPRRPEILRITLCGASVGTEVKHGPLKVYGGLRYLVGEEEGPAR